MWNLLSIVREMYRRRDSNAISLLEILTEEILACDQILIWWFNNKRFGSNVSTMIGRNSNMQSNVSSSQHTASSLCDEIVILWSLASLNPSLSSLDRQSLCSQLKKWQTKCIDKLNQSRSPDALLDQSVTEFTGFKPAIESCLLCWKDLYLPSLWVDKKRTELLTNKPHSLQDRKLSHAKAYGMSRVSCSNRLMFTELDRTTRQSEEMQLECDIMSSNELMTEASADNGHYDDSMACKKSSTEHLIKDSCNVKLSKITTASHANEPLLDDSSFQEADVVNDCKKQINQHDTMLALAEALHAHGYLREACSLARVLATEMLNIPSEQSTGGSEPTACQSDNKYCKRKKKQIQESSYSASLLSKVSFLCLVLSENPEFRSLAFRIGIHGLEMSRAPATNKSLEVKLIYQESELVGLLKKIPLSSVELAVIRERAMLLRDGKLETRGDVLLPISLSGFIFDSLCLPGSKLIVENVSCDHGLMDSKDEQLGFEAAIATLGMKANVSEAEHPLLCEGTRRQRGELILSMLMLYKDDQNRLTKIMNKVLDNVHQLYKVDSESYYYITDCDSRLVSAQNLRTQNSSTDNSVNIETISNLLLQTSLVKADHSPNEGCCIKLKIEDKKADPILPILTSKTSKTVLRDADIVTNSNNVMSAVHTSSSDSITASANAKCTAIGVITESISVERGV